FTHHCVPTTTARHYKPSVTRYLQSYYKANNSLINLAIIQVLSMPLPSQTRRMHQRPRPHLNSPCNRQLHHIKLPPPEPLRLPDKCRSAVPRCEAVYRDSRGAGCDFLGELAEHEAVEQLGDIVAIIGAGF